MANEDELLVRLLLEGKSLKDISAYLDRPASSIRKRLEHLAPQKLKDKFDGVAQSGVPAPAENVGYALDYCGRYYSF
ncbi:hypothetical protein [Bradyrhizobium genosp. P]|uniref:hypothetical protein n=1 Tax=Bradyrhizobium genosp. P TaxID=83641 RepID=UPI003CF65DFD